MSNSQPSLVEKPGAVGSEAIERPVSTFLLAIESVGQTGEPYVITNIEMRELGLFEEVEVRGLDYGRGLAGLQSRPRAPRLLLQRPLPRSSGCRG